MREPQQSPELNLGLTAGAGFDQVMPETREFPRFIPRVGARIRITIGKSLTPRIRPLIEEWRAVAEKESGAVGIGGEWSEGKGDREVRSRGELADGREQALRIKICEILQEAVRELGEAVERKEGKFERGEWSNSMASVDHPA